MRETSTSGSPVLRLRLVGALLAAVAGIPLCRRDEGAVVLAVLAGTALPSARRPARWPRSDRVRVR